MGLQVEAGEQTWVSSSRPFATFEARALTGVELTNYVRPATMPNIFTWVLGTELSSLHLK